MWWSHEIEIKRLYIFIFLSFIRAAQGRAEDSHLLLNLALKLGLETSYTQFWNWNLSNPPVGY